jgi:hypothetical protein
VVRPRGCSSRSNGSPDTSTDRRTNGSTTPAAGDRADHSPCARPDKTATDSALGRIVRVCPGCRCKQQSGANYTDSCRWDFHSSKSSG